MFATSMARRNRQGNHCTGLDSYGTEGAILNKIIDRRAVDPINATGRIVRSYASSKPFGAIDSCSDKFGSFDTPYFRAGG